MGAATPPLPPVPGPPRTRPSCGAPSRPGRGGIWRRRIGIFVHRNPTAQAAEPLAVLLLGWILSFVKMLVTSFLTDVHLFFLSAFPCPGEGLRGAETIVLPRARTHTRASLARNHRLPPSGPFLPRGASFDEQKNFK